MFRLGLVNTLVTQANKEGFGLTPLSGDRRGYMPPLLKTKQNYGLNNNFAWSAMQCSVLILYIHCDKMAIDAPNCKPHLPQMGRNLVFLMGFEDTV